MQNVKLTRQGNILTIEVDLSKQFGPSASGKSVQIASTNGNVSLESGESIGLNVYRRVQSSTAQVEVKVNGKRNS